MIIKVDLDGVLGDNVEMFCEYIRQNYPVDFYPRDVDVYNFEIDKIGLNVGDIVNEIYTEQPSMLLEMNEIKGSLESLKSLEQDHQIKIVTHRPEMVRDETRKWLESKNFSYNELVNAPKDKSKIEGDIMIDDSSKVIRDFKNSRKEAILFPRNYNIQEIPELSFAHHPHNYSKKNTEQIINEESQWEIIKRLIENI